MTPNDLIGKLLVVPFKNGGNDYSGADCWGIVEIWYRERFGMELADRGSISPGPHGLAEGFQARADWVEVDTPIDDDLVILTSRGLFSGHAGIFYNGLLIHTEQTTGCVAQPIKSRLIAPRVTCYLRHKDFD